LSEGDIGADLVVGGVDGGEGAFDFLRGIDSRDQGRIEGDPVARS